MRKLTTPEFIQKAQSIHGDRYDYSLVEYVSAKVKVEIVCRKHGSFWQAPDKHRIGKGCPSCSGNKKLTTDEFIKRAVTTHGDRYDYSNVVYTGIDRGVNITCSVHGAFTQSPQSHINDRQGCPSCGGSKKITIDEFIAQCRETHGDRYDYSRTEYVNARTKVEVICRKHGSFWQAPCSHKNGAGCPLCADNKRDTEGFIEKALLIHGDKYDYSLVEYVDSHTRVTIICYEHGEFLQTPSSHLKQHGCKSCSNDAQRLTTWSFIKKAKHLHGDKYDYSQVIYTGYQTHVKIICPTHGAFMQSPDSHFHGSSCPACAEYGFNPNKQGYLYCLISEGGEYMKVGITNHPDPRMNRLRRATPFPFSVATMAPMQGRAARDLEKFFHSLLDSADLQGFDGATEWFRMDGTIKTIISEIPCP